MKRTMTTAGFSVLALSAMLVTGCSNESKQTAPVSSEAGGAASKAPESGAQASENEQALVRVIDAAPDASSIEVIADQNPIFNRVEYKEVTPYKAVPANFDDFAVKAAGQEQATPLAENSESIMSGRHYTVVVYPEPAARDAKDTEHKVALNVIADDIQPPSAGKARVRVINAAAGTDDIEVFLRGEKDALFDDVDFKEAIAYKEIDPVKTTLEWRMAESLLNTANPKTGDRPNSAADARPGKVLGTHSLNLEAGKSYTIVIAGKSTKFDTIVVEDTVPQPAVTN